MISLAFKRSSAETGPVAIVGQLISLKTGSEFCHVEIVFDMTDPKAALCFSSREPHGAGWQTIDLTNAAMWEIVPLHLTPDQEQECIGFCKGADGKRYDMLGIIGIAVEAPEFHDYSQIFCSETAASMAKQCAGRSLGTIPNSGEPPVERHAWSVSPGDLYELAKSW